MVLLPATAAGADGRRLGQGGGFYDRALASVPPHRLGGPLRVALVHDDELLPAGAVPAGPYDQTVDVVATRPANRAGPARIGVVRFWVLLALLALLAYVLAHWAVTRRSHWIALALLLLVIVPLGFLEVRWRAVDNAVSAATRALVPGSQGSACQRWLGTWAYAGAEWGHVEFSADGTPDTMAWLSYAACSRLKDFYWSDKRNPTLDQVQAVHVVAHEAMHLRGEGRRVAGRVRRRAGDRGGGARFSAPHPSGPARSRSSTGRPPTTCSRRATAPRTAGRTVRWTAPPATGTGRDRAGRHPAGCSVSRSTAAASTAAVV